MNRLFSYIATGLLLVSCSGIGMDDVLRPIGFGVTQTKAPISNAAAMQAHPFKVYGKVGSESLFSGSSTDVEWNETDGAWTTYSPIEYWRASQTYKFRAVWPSAAINSTTTYSDDLASGATITDFKSSSVQSLQTDLLLSGLTTVTTGSSTSGQGKAELEFRHILSKIQVDIKKHDSARDADVFKVKSVEISGMKDMGSFTGTSTSGTWTISSSASDQVCVREFASPLEPLSKSAYTTAWDGGLLLVPQTMTSGAAIKITYSINGGADHSVTVKTASPTTWEMGKKYTYQIALNATPIEFAVEVTVTDWTTESDIDITPAS